MPPDGFLDQIEHRAQVVTGQAHGQVRDQAFEDQLQERGQDVHVDVVAQVAGVALALEPLTGRDGQLDRKSVG